MLGNSLLALSAVARPFLPTDPDILLTRPEAAQYLRVSVQTLARWDRLGVGPDPLRVGRLVRYRLSDVRGYPQARAA